MAVPLRRLKEIIEDGGTFTPALRKKVQGRLGRERDRYSATGKATERRREIIEQLERLLEIDAERKCVDRTGQL